MGEIFNSSFNKHTMSWELNYLYLIHPYASVIKAMCHHQTLTSLPKHWPKKINEAPYTVCYTAKITTLPKGTTVDTNSLWPGELIHVEFTFYDVALIQVVTSMLTVVCENTTMIRVFLTASKKAPVRIICFILTTLKNEKHPCWLVGVD